MHQGRIRQGRGGHCRHQLRAQHSSGQGGEASERIAHQHGGLLGAGLHHLFQKGSELTGPKAIVDRPLSLVTRLLRAPEANEIEAIHLETSRRERCYVVAPMVAAGTKAVQQHEGPAIAGAKHPPVTLQSLPLPEGSVSPIAQPPICLRGSLESGCIHGRLSQNITHYREGAAQLELGNGFFRPDSRPSRDLSVLLAAWQLQQRGERPCRWLDLMAGCGIRSLRWGLEALRTAGASAGPVTLTVNDADEGRDDLLRRNLAPLEEAAVAVQLQQQPAEVLLRRAYLEKQHFDLIDLDAFGCPNALLQAALQALAFGGVLLLASTDGRSPTGHDRPAAVRRFGASARAHPASWELALRLQLAALAREAWMLGRGLEPLVCFSDGRTFRLAVRLTQRAAPHEERQLGLVARCEACGDQAQQSLLKLQGWPACGCGLGQGRWAVSGPLWLGPLQSPIVIGQLLALADGMEATLAPAGRRLLQRLQHDSGLPVSCWSTAELARRLQLPGPPGLTELVDALRALGHQACASGVMAGQVRTDAPLDSLLQSCRNLGGKDR